MEFVLRGDAMKIRAKYAEFVGYVMFNGERFNEWRCHEKNCGMSVSEEYNFCPYCGRKLIFEIPDMTEKVKDTLRRFCCE